MNKPYKYLTVFTVLLVIGEAAALLVGMCWLSPQPNPWLTALNQCFLLTDLLLGFLLLFLTGKQDNLSVVIFYISASLLLFTHLYREMEYFLGLTASSFVSNIPLLVVNNLKLFGLAFVLVFHKSRFKS